MNQSQSPSLVRARPFSRILEPFERFVQIEAASGIVLVAAASMAVVWANSPWRTVYEQWWRTSLTLGWGARSVTQPLHFVVNDGLMTIFFLLVGLEIRREVHHGALSSISLALLPLFAALGGVLAPASIYLAFNPGSVAQQGWAIPTATDIAFAVGILALLGRRVPPALRVLLLAVAVIDDVIAIVIIALFYSHGIAVGGMLLASAGIVVVLLFQRLGVHSALAYVPPGVVIWSGLWWAGVHPALAGVALGLLTPVTSIQREVSPLARLQDTLHPWVAFGIMPLFAFANAGVSFQTVSLNRSNVLVGTGIALGLLIGKPLGILAASACSVRLGVSRLPEQVTFKNLALVSCLGGVGFTMSIFIANLAFEYDAKLLDLAKLAVLCGSCVAAIGGLLIGHLVLPKAATSVDSTKREITPAPT